ncbi:MAG: DUF6599 family protein [Candidatus Zipacnadales bacterium]
MLNSAHLVAVGLNLVLLSSCAPAAQVIDLWKVRRGGLPSTQTTPSPSPKEAGEVTTEGTTASPEQPVPSDNRLAEILTTAAKLAGLSPLGEITTLSSDDLKPASESASAPPLEAEAGIEASIDAEARAEGEATPPPALPAAVGAEPFDDYHLTMLAAGEFSQSGAQTVQAVLFELETAEEAWGLFSRGRGPKVIRGVGQAANFGNDLRFWKGRYAGVLRIAPPDPRMDEIRLTKFGCVMAAMLPGSGRPPELISWLPLTNQIPHSVIYFHANGPIAAETLALSSETEGAAAEYQIGEEVHGVVVVRYPDEAAALAGWRAFTTSRTGRNPDEGRPGGRKTGLLGGRWNATLAKGRVCGFVLGTATRNQAEVAIAQVMARATD